MDNLEVAEHPETQDNPVMSGLQVRKGSREVVGNLAQQGL